MVNSCVLPGCSSQFPHLPKAPDGSNIVMFQLPFENEELVKKWCNAIPRLKKGQKPRKSWHICSLHPSNSQAWYHQKPSRYQQQGNEKCWPKQDYSIGNGFGPTPHQYSSLVCQSITQNVILFQDLYRQPSEKDGKISREDMKMSSKLFSKQISRTL